jgi:hypothetical protein
MYGFYSEDFYFYFELAPHYIAQAGFYLLDLNYSLASTSLVAKTRSVCHHTWLRKFFKMPYLSNSNRI